MPLKIPESLSEFINNARARGKSEEQIKNMLLSSGWEESVVMAALQPLDELTPPMPPAPKSTGREIFFYLLQFFTLGTAAISLGGVIFSLINHYFSDEILPTYYNTPPVTSALASLMVALPVFVGVSWKLIKDTREGRASVRSGIRRVLTYLALFLASATVIGDIIALVYRFLAGEVDSRFLLKVATILLIGGWIIWYYYVTVKCDERGQAYPARWHSNHAVVLIVVFVVAVVSGFIISGTPQERQRLVRDNQRIMELQNIYWQIQSYYEQKGSLPESLTQLDVGYMPQQRLDPLTNEPYRYLPGPGLTYELCATFETDDKQLSSKNPRLPESLGGVNWTHPAGDYCFQLEVKPLRKPTT